MEMNSNESKKDDFKWAVDNFCRKYDIELIDCLRLMTNFFGITSHFIGEEVGSEKYFEYVKNKDQLSKEVVEYCINMAFEIEELMESNN